MKNTNIEWRNADSTKRVKFLNVISNKRKIFKNNDQDEDEFFYDFIQFQKKAMNESKTLSKINLETEMKILGEENLELNNSAIYVSFRLGAFWVIPLMVLRKKGDITILVTKKTYSTAIDLLNENGLKDEFEVIVVNEATGFRKVIKESRKGKSFFCLVDVGDGLNKDKSEDKNITTIDLNGVSIEAMIGIPYLSYYLNIPLIPVFSYRIAGDTFIKIEKPIDKGIAKDRFDFSHKATHFLWERFEKYVNKYPAQWESLYYIHHYYLNEKIEEEVLNGQDEKVKYQFNDKKYDFILSDNKYYLYNYDTLETFLTTEYLYTFLHKIFKNKFALNIQELKIFIKEKSVMNQLFSKKILLTV